MSIQSAAVEFGTAEQRITPYDEFNIDIPHDHFPEHGMSARARRWRS